MPSFPFALRRRLPAVAAAAVCAAALTGCADFASPPTASQSGGIGAVHIQTAICLDGFGANSNDEIAPSQNPTPWSSPPGCTGSSITGSSSPAGQLLVGYLVPDAASAPATLASPDLPGIAFTPDSDYTTYLTANQGATSGEHWVGYMSDEITQTVPQLVHLDAAFSLPPGSGGVPFAAQATVGDRASGANVFGSPATLDPSRALDCAEMVTAPAGLGGVPAATTGCVEDDQAVTVATHDLALIAPGAATVAPGGSVTLPFALAASGPASSAPTVTLSASTDDATLTATPADSSLTPTGSSTEGVTVTAPATLAPGTYHVTLTADGGCGAADCTRAATATVTVAASPAATVTPAAPTVTPTTTPTPAPLTERLSATSPVSSAGSLFAHGVATTIACNESCAVDVTLLVNHRAQLRGQRWERFYRRYTQAHADAAATLPAMGASTQETVVHEIVNLPHAGSRRVILRIAGAQAKLLPWAGSIAVGVSTYGIGPDGERVTAVSRHWQSVSGHSVFQRLRARGRR